MAERGMKKYLPFASLVEQAKYLKEIMIEKKKIERPLVSIEQAKKINDILLNYDNEILTMKLYIDGFLVDYKGKIVINKKNKTFMIDNKQILPIKDIIDIESLNEFLDIC